MLNLSLVLGQDPTVHSTGIVLLLLLLLLLLLFVLGGYNSWISGTTLFQDHGWQEYKSVRKMRTHRNTDLALAWVAASKTLREISGTRARGQLLAPTCMIFMIYSHLWHIILLLDVTYLHQGGKKKKGHKNIYHPILQAGSDMVASGISKNTLHYYIFYMYTHTKKEDAGTNMCRI